MTKREEAVIIRHYRGKATKTSSRDLILAVLVLLHLPFRVRPNFFLFPVENLTAILLPILRTEDKVIPPTAVYWAGWSILFSSLPLRHVRDGLLKNTTVVMHGGLSFGGYSSISPQFIPPTEATQLPLCSMQPWQHSLSCPGMMIAAGRSLRSYAQ